MIQKVCVLLIYITVLSCGSEEKNLGDVTNYYIDEIGNGSTRLTFDSGINKCSIETTDQLVDKTITAAEKIGQACERQNENMAENGYRRCPTNTCMSTHEKGGMTAPSMEITISNSSRSSSFGYGSFSSYSGTASSNTGNKVYVTVTMKINLAKNPDKITCINPLSPNSIDRVIEEVLKVNNENPC